MLLLSLIPFYKFVTPAEAGVHLTQSRFILVYSKVDPRLRGGDGMGVVDAKR